MLELPPGHSHTGVSVPALGGLVHRVRRDSDGAELLVRSASQSPDDAIVQHLDAEFGTPRGEGDDEHRDMLRPIARVDGQRHSWIVYDLVLGHPLSVAAECDLDEFWDIAEATTSALADGHRRGRMHGRLESNCVWWDRRSQRAALLGMVPAEHSHLAHQLPPSSDTAPELLLDPPNRVNPAADVYSLGAIFYRLLSGRAPVPSTGNLSFDVAAIAPTELSSEAVPPALAALLARMLSKSPALRPPTANAVLDELRAVRRGVGSTPPPSSENLARIGRSSELRFLKAQADSAEGGIPGIVRITGEPGIGKSTLLAQFMRDASPRTRIVADGKFEQFRRGRPYDALLTACSNALSHVLAADEAVFATTKESLRSADLALLAALGPDIRELELLCGRLPTAPPAGPTENQNRFKRAFRELLTILCAAAGTLVLVLDDLQWADRATADLLFELITAGLPEHLLLVLAYRESTARQATELTKLLPLLDQAPILSLQPFTAQETEALCRGLLPDCDGGDLLAHVAHLRSQGNALHCVELLKSFATSGDLSRVGGTWRYRETGGDVHDLSATVLELIQERLLREPIAMQFLLSAAALTGRHFSVELLAAAMGHEARTIEVALRAAVDRGFLVAGPHSSEYAFCHDRIQQVALELTHSAERDAVHLRLGRYYQGRTKNDRSALFPCVEHLNRVREALDEEERHALALLNLEGARRARATIAYEHAIPLVRIYLESSRPSRNEHFQATLLLAECLSLAEAGTETPDRREGSRPSRLALVACADLAATDQERLELAYSRLLFCVHHQEYAAGVDVALDALRLLAHPLPRRPWMPRVIASIVLLTLRMRRLDPKVLASRSDRSTERDMQVFRFLVGLWGPSHWTSPGLNALVCVELMLLTLRCGNGQHSSMAYISHAAICHMQGQFALAMRYARIADTLARDHSVYVRSVVRFLRLTFLGVFEWPPHEVIQRYDEAMREGIAHGEIVASHIIDGAVTTLPHLGPDLSRVRASLERYRKEARVMGARTSLEMIHLVECWSNLLADGADELERRIPHANALCAPVEHSSFAAGRDILRMQIEYLWNRDDEVLRLASAVQGDLVLKGNPLHKASHALFVVLASTRRHGKLPRSARKALSALERIDRVDPPEGPAPHTFRASLRLAQGVLAVTRGDARAEELLNEAIALAREKDQGFLRAVALERLAQLHGISGRYAEWADCIRASAQAFRRFGATAKADAMMHAFPSVDWTHVRTQGVGLQIEGIMRSATAIVEATSSEELGPTLLRVIATAAGAMRAFLFTPIDGQLTLVAGCERDRENLGVARTPISNLDPRYFGIRAVHRVERSHEPVVLPRDRSKFLDDPYLTGPNAPGALLAVPLLYRGDLVAVLYLEQTASADSFSASEVMLVTLLGKQAAIAITNADNHKLEVEALQSKINPHFLYNALSVIAELIGRKPDEAEDAVYKLTRLYRYMVTSHGELRVPLEKELDVVRDYLELERARFGERLKVAWDIETLTTSLRVPALLLQPLAENAVNHGICRNERGGTVSLSTRLVTDTLVITVRDNGPGWYGGKGGTGFGLKSVRRRLQLLYGDRAEIRITKREGVSVELRIPV